MSPDFEPEDFEDLDDPELLADLDSALDDHREARGQWGDDHATYSALPSDLPEESEPWSGDHSRLTFLDRCFGRGMSFAEVLERYS